MLGSKKNICLPEPQPGELREVAYLWREVYQLVVLQVELDQLPTLPQLRGQVLQLVVAAVQARKLPQLSDTRRQLGDLVLSDATNKQE